MIKEFKVNVPEGYEIDEENSTFECIKFKPIGERWRDKNSEITGYFLSGNCVRCLPADFHEKWDYDNHDTFATEKQAKSALAMAQISQIMANDKRFGGVVTDEEFKDENVWIYSINRNKNNIGMYQGFYGVDHFLSFHTLEQRDLFLEENKDLVKDYLMID